MADKGLDGRAKSIDIHVGRRIRRRREALGISQEALGKIVGPIAFQQVQKYEKGDNRVSASRLWLIAEALNTTVSYFFEGLDSEALESAPDPIERFGTLKGAHDIARAVNGMTTEKRNALRELLADVPMAAAAQG